MNVEFTDRYGGNLPCWLTACHDQCEATGWIPAEPEWIRCPACGGTGRVGYLRAILNLPRWVWKGATFILQMRGAEMHPPDWTAAKRLRLLVWCAWGADLQALWRQVSRPSGEQT